MNARILVAIFHKPGKDDENFERLKTFFAGFDTFIPTVNYYGNKWNEARQYFLAGNYDSLFLICSDVSIVCGDLHKKIIHYANDKSTGMYGFGTINNFTFSWLQYTNLQLQRSVPFIEGYCLGINKELFPHLTIQSVYGYGLEIEMGYRSHQLGLSVILDSEVCISHAQGKSYSAADATKEYCDILLSNPGMHKYLKDLGIYTPI